MSEIKEASTLQKKRNNINTTKLRKSIKNVLCRPDPLRVTPITQEEGQRLESALKKYKIGMPEFKKPHWKDLKLIPKEQRPKPPKLKKVDGLILGVRECTEAIQNGECSAIIIEAKVNPKVIVQPIIEMCIAKDIPLLYLDNLRKVSTVNFGIPTSCLGIKCNYLLDVRKEIVEISKKYLKPKQTLQQKEKNDNLSEKMVIDEDVDTREAAKVNNVTTFEYLYRTNKKTRVFVPAASEHVLKQTSTFIGQDFVKFSHRPEQKNNNAFMKMLVKKFSNNPDRVKKK